MLTSLYELVYCICHLETCLRTDGVPYIWAVYNKIIMKKWSVIHESRTIAFYDRTVACIMVRFLSSCTIIVCEIKSFAWPWEIVCFLPGPPTLFFTVYKRQYSSFRAYGGNEMFISTETSLHLKEISDSEFLVPASNLLFSCWCNIKI